MTQPSDEHKTVVQSTVSRLKRVWADPVWSKVIAGVILGTGGLMWTFSGQLKGVWRALLYAVDEPVHLRLWEVIALVAVAWIVGLVVALFVRRSSNEVARTYAPADVSSPHSKGMAAVAEEIEYREPSYFIKRWGGGEDGPFCQRCYDADKKLIRTHDKSVRGGTLRLCVECKAQHWIKPPPPASPARRLRSNGWMGS